MKMTVIVVSFAAVFKRLERELEYLEIRGRIETILLKYLDKVLETYENWYFSDSGERSSIKQVWKFRNWKHINFNNNNNNNISNIKKDNTWKPELKRSPSKRASNIERSSYFLESESQPN